MVTAHSCGYGLTHIGTRISSICSAYLVPDAKLNVLSCSHLDDRGAATTFTGGKCVITNRDDRKSIFEGIQQRTNGCLYAAKILPPKGTF